jgi:hypothetical protein
MKENRKLLKIWINKEGDREVECGDDNFVNEIVMNGYQIGRLYLLTRNVIDMLANTGNGSRTDLLKLNN